MTTTSSDDATPPAAPARTREESAATGRAARSAVPRRTLGSVDLARDRDPVGLVLGQDETRVPELVPVRHERMAVSPFTFFRGAALPMADDLATAPSPGLTVQLCGDAHLSNFGMYASPERRLVFDLNDFDETLPGPFEWDLERLVASVAVAGRENDLKRKERRAAVLATVAAYRTGIRQLAAMPVVDVWYAHLEVEEAIAQIRTSLVRRDQKRVRASVAKARRRDGVQAVTKLTEVVDGRRRIVADPPLVVPLEDLASVLDPALVDAVLRDVVRGYTATLDPDPRWLVEQFDLVQVARKVVGVGSVGTRAWILLFEPHDGMAPLLLQAKEAGRSVLAGYLGESEYEHAGRRVVEGQRRMQAVSDVLLGWHRTDGSAGQRPADYYVRQLRDWKFAAVVSQLDAKALAVYAGLCGRTLARAHARTGDRIAIATYLGSSDTADQALADFAEEYADVTERDHAAFVARAGLVDRQGAGEGVAGGATAG
ncbi:DUF2252 domain-containing protein [Luteimicrobium subarcticum]|uniref:Uncharacterized protein (DUF2252 family) n=1 Tax=Luteimicrobium subarcticum TaxID=620910 RepID=A0A2M8W6X2_9MICO|nr:DUF2252 domain-containing protein [Luteimicrobium subarcticum]PJI86642.1 uncharacterized protein (DUF2252 family) [Luteimicrobium subarcticum]